MLISAGMRNMYPSILLALVTGCGVASSTEEPTIDLFDASKLVDVHITMPPAAWEELRNQGPGVECATKNTTSFRYTYFRAEVSVNGETRDSAGVRKKSMCGSLSSTKPALKIKFDKFIEGQTLGGIKRITLNNAIQDESYVRQCVGYAVFAAAGLPASRCSYARVWVNGADMGIYINVEPVKKPMLRRFYDDDDGNLYEGVDSDFVPDRVGFFELKTNEIENDRTDLGLAVAALQQSGEPMREAVDRIIDTDTFMTFWAVERILEHWDGYSSGLNNYFIYRDPADGRFDFLPWGIDLIMLDPLSEDLPPNGILPRRLLELAGTQQLLNERVRAVLESSWDTTALVDHIDAAETLIAPVLAAHGEQWKHEAIARARDFVSNRKSVLLNR